MRRVIFLSFVFAIITGEVCALRSLKAVDLHVYYAAARSFFLLSGPMYGTNQDFGWPILYRYPPLFLCLFRPLASLPLSVVAGVWAGLKVLLVGPLAWLWYRRFGHGPHIRAVSFSACLILPYVVYELRSGNVQFLLVELVCLALLVCHEDHFTASFLLGLAAAIKVWPLFILPFMALRGRWRVSAQACLATALFTVAPAVWLGWRTTVGLLVQWFNQEKRINAMLGERWYPSQSLRGVMLRYFTRMDYSDLPDHNYRPVNFVSLPSWEVRQFWLVLAVLLVVFALAWVYRCPDDAGAYSVFFCFLAIVAPYTRTMYTTLLWPSLFAGIAMTNPKAPRFVRWALTGAAGISVIAPLVPGSAAQRLAQVLGVDFLAFLLPLTLGLVIYTSHPRGAMGADATKRLIRESR